MQKAALDNLIGQLRVKTTWCDEALVSFFKMPGHMGMVKVVIKLNINGQDLVHESMLDGPFSLETMAACEVIKLVGDMMVKALTELMLEQAVGDYVELMAPIK